MNYYDRIKNELINNEIYKRVKDYSKERNRVITYFKIGKLLNEAGNNYGDKIIEEYSKQLVIEVGKQYNKRTLFRMKKLYIVFSNEKMTTLLSQLTWSHYLLLLSIKEENEIIYYINIAKKENLTQRELQKRIKSQEYERLPKEYKEKTLNNVKPSINDNIPSPILINNKNNIEVVNENILHQIILEDISSFMKELGSGYSFIDSEYKIKIGNSYNYIDLLLFNYDFNCFVIIELKITSLKKEHIGQILIYMNYIDKLLKKSYMDNTIGIIICKHNNKFVIEYSSNPNIFSRTFKLMGGIV